MTYAANDISVSEGRPMEFFKFEGQLRNYLYVNQAESLSLGGEVYEPATLFRSNIEVGSILTSQKTVSVSVPSNSDLAKDYGGKTTPNKLQFTLYRAYRGDDLTTQFKQRFTGRAIAYAYEDRMFQIAFNNVLATDLTQQNRSIYAQPLCNHKLYDERCKANKVLNTSVSTVEAFSDTAVEVADDGWANGDLKVGSIVNVRTGEERLIFDNLENVISIGYPFLDIEVGDEVQMIRGCNHGSSDCVLKFNNYVNYGGFLFMPDVNPFENEF